MFRNQDSKFVDPSFFVDPLSFEFTGIHNDIRISFGSNAANQQREFQERIAREEAQLIANRLAQQEAAAQEAVKQQQAAMQAEGLRQQEVQNIYSQILAETKAQAEIQQRRSTAALNQQKVLSQQQKVAAATQQGSNTLTIGQQRRTSVGQPGVSRTRLSTGTTVGGFSGTSPGRINPTGLNI